MKRLLVVVFGVFAYVVGAGAYFAGFGGFLGGFLGRYSINAGQGAAFWPALLTNVGLIVLFGLPHSLMARPGFKRWWTRLVPEALERSVFMLQAGLLALVLIWRWRAMPETIWHVEGGPLSTVLWGVFWSGWLIAFVATFLINHFELTGLQQVYAYARNRKPEPMRFRTPFLYKVVRHPMQFGMLLALWATPHMTVGRLLFALGMTGYILIGLHFEERDLVRQFGAQYVAYQQTTPKLIPLWRRPATGVSGRQWAADRDL